MKYGFSLLGSERVHVACAPLLSSTTTAASSGGILTGGGADGKSANTRTALVRIFRLSLPRGSLPLSCTPFPGNHFVRTQVRSSGRRAPCSAPPPPPSPAGLCCSPLPPHSPSSPIHRLPSPRQQGRQARVSWPGFVVVRVEMDRKGKRPAVAKGGGWFAPNVILTRCLI